MSLALGSGLYPRPVKPLEERIVTATYTYDVSSSLDGFDSARGGDWAGCCGSSASSHELWSRATWPEARAAASRPLPPR